MGFFQSPRMSSGYLLTQYYIYFCKICQSKFSNAIVNAYYLLMVHFTICHLFSTLANTGLSVGTFEGITEGTLSWRIFWFGFGRHVSGMCNVWLATSSLGIVPCYADLASIVTQGRRNSPCKCDLQLLGSGVTRVV